jgi:asparagine synthase (glutamine-hydrolysing)
MCGIAGVVDWQRPADGDAVRRMVRRLAHRGPDHEAVQLIGTAVLGYRRLAIIDLSPDANQPMHDSDRRVAVIFNGEIYNYRELRAELQGRGARFRTRSDTEVLLEGYKCWGDEVLRRLNGMFAFALWDEKAQRLLLARDRLGEKPLYYAPLADHGLAFASELKALRLYPGVDTALNPAAISHYLSLNYILHSESILRGVHKLPPGHYLVAERGKSLHTRSYWDLARTYRDKPAAPSRAEAAEKLTSLIDDAVRLRLISDVPLGAFLSGGIDSSAVVAAMRKAGPEAVLTFSIGFHEAGFDETPFARETAGALATRHEERFVDVDLAADLPAIVSCVDEPFADSSIVPTYHLAKFARSRVTVCLSGDGGDEIFAGYPTYAADRLRHHTRLVPAPLTRTLSGLADRLTPARHSKVGFGYKLRQFLRGHSLGPRRSHYSWRTIFTDDEKRALLRADVREAVMAHDPYALFDRYFDEVRGCHYLDQAMYVDTKTWLPDDILVKVDQATMAHSLEARPPLLDHRVVEYAASLPVSWKHRGLRGKYLFRLSQRGRVPSSALGRRKAGFNAPVSQWLSGELLKLARDATLSNAMRQWFDVRRVEQLWQDHLMRRRDAGLALFGLTCLGLWFEAWKKGGIDADERNAAG